MKRLSMFNNAYCEACGRPAAEGLADSEGLWCEFHGRMRAVGALERACFDVLHTYGREDFRATIMAVEDYRSDDPFHLYSSELALAELVVAA